MGSYAHPEEEKIYYFVTGDVADGIFEYDIINNSISTIVIDSSNLSVANNTELNFHKGFCRSLANAKAPTYICKDPFMCKPEEFSLAITALGQNSAEYNHCMYKKGYKSK